MNQGEDTAPVRPFEADGIQELDNNLPQWWVGLFIFTIVFGILYMTYMHLFGGMSIQSEFAESQKQTFSADSPTPSNENEPKDLNAMLGHDESIKSGSTTYGANCAPCHGGSGEGKIGPNLTDNFWIHGGKPNQILTSILNGVPEKGMPAWGQIVGEAKAKQLAAYIVSLKGTNPPNAKAPQGTVEN